MIGPQHMGSSPALKRQLSRLSSSSSFQVRQSNSRIYTFLIAGGLLLLATVALLSFHLQGAPQSSKLSPRENGKSDEGIVPVQSWWNGNDGNQVPVKERVVEKSKLGRKMGPVQVDKDGEEEDSSDEGMDVVDEMEDDEEEESDQQALFDIDVDDRMLDEEPEDEDPDLAIRAEMSNDEDSAEDSTENLTNETGGKSRQKVSENIVSAVSADEQEGERVDSAKSVGVALVDDKNDSSILTDHDRKEVVRHESNKDDKMVKVDTIPNWVLDIKLGSQQERVVDTLQGFERDLVKDLEKKKGSFFWDHAPGIKKRSLENVGSLNAEDTKDDVAVVKSGGNVDTKDVATENEVAAKVAMQHLKGFKDFVESWTERFNSDDELVDDNVQLRLEAVREIEDALLLNGDGAADKSKKFSALLNKGRRGAFDRMNPTSNPMLQDPDTPPGTWMTKTDKEMLRAIRGDRSNGGQLPKALLRGNILNVVTVEDSAVRRQASTR